MTGLAQILVFSRISCQRHDAASLHDRYVSRHTNGAFEIVIRPPRPVKPARSRVHLDLLLIQEVAAAWTVIDAHAMKWIVTERVGRVAMYVVEAIEMNREQTALIDNRACYFVPRLSC